MLTVKHCRTVWSRLLVFTLAVAMVFTMMPLTGNGVVHAKTDGFTLQQPVMAVTGQELIGGVYTKDNVSNERSYTLDELKQMEVVTGQMYSARKSDNSGTRNRVYVCADGVTVESLLQASGTSLANVQGNLVVTTGSYACTFKQGTEYNNDGKAKTTKPALANYNNFYDGFSPEKRSEVPPILSWAFNDYTEEGGGVPADEDKPVPPTTENSYLRLIVGQHEPVGDDGGPDDMNYPLYNGKNGDAPNRIIVGNPITETALTIGSKAYTRSDLLLMQFAEASYTYETTGGSATDYVRGVPMSVLLDGYNDDDVVTFGTADNYNKIGTNGYTVKQLIDNDYMLAYEVGTSAANLKGNYDTAKNDASKYGFLRLYGSDENGKPVKLVNKITVTAASGTDFSTSPYKHITNGGQGGSAPYNIDAITGATLTVEGPGVEKSVPVSVRDLEGRDAGVRRANYTDKRSGVDATRTYEGVDLNYILTKMNSGENGIKMTDKAAKVQIKNRNRKTIAEFTVKQVEDAGKTDTPIIVAYGTSYQDGTNISPFVFDNGEGADETLGNEDGCIKLVYNKAGITGGDPNADYTTFGNMAYIYVAEADTPGYKHNKDPYQSADISNYVLTVTGEKIGREVNYTVKQLEDMVEYGENGKPDNNGMGYRDEYSLANSTYWYVNEYEGVQLWKLLLRSGLPASYSSDDETIVSSTATDGYAATDKFTTKQVADPNSFGFYEKNPADLNDGKYEGNENIRQNDDVSTGDKLRVGYPVLVAYGVNGYPYVEKTTQEGYLSGLQNDGGPLRIISGKKKYNHANGSNQAKLLDKVLVGEDTYHYSTHKYSDKAVYRGLADQNLNIKILNGPEADAPLLKDKDYAVGDLEELIYGDKLTVTQLGKAKVKDFYGVTKNGNVYSDLYEGVDLQYFLTDVVEIPGYKGTITFSNGTTKLSLNLEDVLKASGNNGDTGKSGLKPVLAYGKNGSPMVATKNAEDGYEDKVTLAEGTEYENKITIKNNGGPLQLTFPTIEGNADMSEKTLTGINSITINLSADKYAHTKAPYDTYKDDTVTIFGEGTRLTEAKAFPVSELEGKQTIAFTGDYSILKDGAAEASQSRYRGIDLYALLTSTAVGLKSNADKVIVTTTDNESKEFTLSEIRKKYKNTVTGEDNLPVILAYGAGKAGEADKEDGLPFVAEKSSEGYDKDYGNNGGPIRLAVGQTDADDVNSGKNMKYVKSIEVTASEVTSWNHSVSEIYKQYLTETVNLQVVDKEGKELFNKNYTVGDIEEQTSLIEQMKAKTTQEDTWEGINFWKFVKQEAGSIDGLDDPVTIDVSAADGFSKELRSIFGMDALQDGIKDGETYVPIILAYGVNGAPLVIGDKTYPNGEGYDATIGNNGGPIRLVTHNNQGASLTYVKKIKVTVGDAAPAPETKDFVIKGLTDDDVELSVEDISKLKNAAGDKIGQAEATFTHKKGTDKVKGVYLQALLAAQGAELENTKITLNATDGYESKESSYKDITLKDAAKQNYFVAYQVWNSETNTWEAIADADKTEQATVSTIRIYRNYNEALGNDPATDWRNRCTNISGITLELPEVTKFKEYATSSVRSAVLDPENTLWVGTYGGGLFYKDAGNRSFRVLNTESDPALKTDYTSAAAVDADGGIWVSQNASYVNPGDNQGVMYIKDGKITQYTAEDSPKTIADNYVQAIKVDTDGKVWFGSFGGLTIYDPANGTWTTFNKENSGFPATSINTITLDGQGGAWLGFYPDGTGTAEDPYTGGFCHIDANGTVSEKTVAVGEMTTDKTIEKPTSKLAQAWVRSIAIDKKGTVWVVASGTNLKENEGGTVWKLKNGTGEPTKYTGDELFGDYLDGSDTTEVRIVAVDADGALWFGTSADGVLKVENAKPNADGTFNVAAQYAAETGAWRAANRNNVFYIGFLNGNTAYVGSAGGMQVLGEEPASAKEAVGGETVDTATLVADGKGVVKNGYFSVKSLKNAEGVKKVDSTYRWRNKSGATGENTFQGVYLENLLKDVVGLKDGVRYVTVISNDNKEIRIDLDEIEATDLDGNKPMIAWQSDEDPDNPKIDPMLVVGQYSREDANKGKWLRNVAEIRADLPTALETEQYEAIDEIKDAIELTEYSAKNRAIVISTFRSAMTAIKSAKTDAAILAAKTDAKADIQNVEKKVIAGDKTRETATFIVDGDGAVKNGYFDVKSLKNSGVPKQENISYSWKNSGGSTGTNTFDGAYLEDLFCGIIGLTEGARSFTVITSDNKEKKFDLQSIYQKDKDGHQAMIAWKSDEDPANSKIDPKLVIGQADADAVNKSSWMSGVKEIRIDLPTELELAQDAGVIEIAAYVNVSDYDKAEQQAVSTVIADTTLAIRDAKTLGEVEKAIADGKKAIDQIQTSEQKAAALAKAKEDACSAIDGTVDSAKESLGAVIDPAAKKEAADKIDKAVAAAKAKIDEISKIENVAPIAAEAAQTIQDIAADALTKANEKALAVKKSEATKAVMDYLNEHKDDADVAASTAAALEAILAINNAKDVNDINDQVERLKSTVDALVEQKAEADRKAAEENEAARAEAAAEQKAAAQAAYEAALAAFKAKAMTVKEFKVKAKKGKKANLTWKKTAGASGYEIYRSTKKKGSYKLIRTIGNAKTVKAVDKKLKAKKTYYYKIRPYKTIKDPSGQTVKVKGKFSKVKKIKAK